MREAAIVSAARTPIGRAFRGAFNQTPGATMAGHVVAEAMKRAGVDPAEVEDVVIGSGCPKARPATTSAAPPHCAPVAR